MADDDSQKQRGWTNATITRRHNEHGWRFLELDNAIWIQVPPNADVALVESMRPGDRVSVRFGGGAGHCFTSLGLLEGPWCERLVVGEKVVW